MYENVKTWNPISGECPHHCPYCAVKKMFDRKLPGAIAKYSGELRLNEKELKRNLGKGNTWFLAGVGNDLFSEGVDQDWITQIIFHCLDFPHNTYMLQTKDTENMFDWFQWRKLPNNFMIGTTIETFSDSLALKYSGGDYPERRAYWLSQIKHDRKYVTIEPIIGHFFKHLISAIKEIKTEVVFIGANSYSKISLPEPSKEEVLALIEELSKFTKVIQKSNLSRLIT